MGFVKGTLQILGTVCKPHLKFGGFPSQKPLKNQSKFKKSKNHYFSRTLNILKSIVYQQKVLKPNSLLKLNEKKLPHFSGFESILLAFTTKSPNLMVRRMTRNHPNLPTRTTPTLSVTMLNVGYAPSYSKSMSSGSLNNFVTIIYPACLTTGKLTVYLLLDLTNCVD